MDTTNIIFWCAEECKRQRSGEMSVAHMFRAWNFARLMAKAETPITVDLIIRLGQMVEPQENLHGFRKKPVVFSNGTHGIDYREIPDAMERLIAHADPKSMPLDFYHAFQQIHPFGDGNGRVGAILFNWENLDSPVAPPCMKV